VGGDDLLKLSNADLDHYRRSRVGFVWQQGSRNLIPYLTALENVELPLTLAGQVGRAAHLRAGDLLEAVGLSERRRHHLGQLSGGEQQRVAIAVALSNQPDMLLADEPTGEMDTATALTIYTTFRKLNRDLGLTTLIVSHDPGIARHLDRVVEVRDGKLATETVRQSPPPDSPGREAGEEEFQKLVVLDSAGRLQVPKEYLERFHIQRRAHLEILETGILIRPTGQAEQLTTEGKAETLPATRPARGLRGWLGRWRRGNHL
jgi:ABC-type lipoprotein export system ATPase subunit